jgi:hypothetical protein
MNWIPWPTDDGHWFMWDGVRMIVVEVSEHRRDDGVEGFYEASGCWYDRSDWLHARFARLDMPESPEPLS